eukprot:gnl/TRDRNA2_/TRDRNA2_138812_c0_seq1.p1 gnl/TRDRNA2_/TRDRNA2_138812_c0~~gnl/TRDRNA2_/TRDRNA2_138812_c0_seq1.p1  ORF type:complete len:120 (-),score=15.87 gnl/TRDRNA2_/TRDRNA2_138812_c0_seq1:210-569(-)
MAVDLFTPGTVCFVAGLLLLITPAELHWISACLIVFGLVLILAGTVRAIFLDLFTSGCVFFFLGLALLYGGANVTFSASIIALGAAMAILDKLLLQKADVRTPLPTAQQESQPSKDSKD